MVTIFICITMFGYWFRLQAYDEAAFVIAQKLVYMGGCHLYYLMLLFIIHHCRIRVHKRIKIGAIVINSAIMVSVMLFEYHKLFYKSYQVVVKNGFYVLEKEYGPLHTIYMFSIMFYSLLMLAITLWHMYYHGKDRRIHSFVLFLVVFFPTGTYAAEKIFDMSYDIVPFGLIISLVLILYLMYVAKIYDVRDIAREFALASMQDALIIIDSKNRYKGSNDLAKRLFPELKDSVIDKKLDDLSKDLTDIISSEKPGDIIFNQKIYELKIIDLKNTGINTGKAIWFMDVTTHREHLRLLHNYHRDLQQEVERKTAVIQKMQEDIIISFANIIESRDVITGGHAKRTSGYVNILIDNLKKQDTFSEFQNTSYVRHVCMAAPLHDIGKIAIPDRILNKSGKYEPGEYDVMKLHPTLGSRLIDDTLASLDDKDYYEIAKQMAAFHHERWDGGGYPYGLEGEEIPICARIMSVADVFDALTSERTYKEAYSVEKAVQIIAEGRGTQFDPQLVDVFLQCQEQFEELCLLYNGGIYKSK